VSDADANREVVRRFEEEVFNQGRLELADDLMAADAVNHSPLPGEEPGPAGIRQTYEVMNEAFTDYRVGIERLVAEGDFVAELLLIEGTHTGTYLGLPATGRRVSVPEINIYRLEAGRIVERWGVLDRFAMLEQLRD
jgi:steroid delta-isomerase-like uncharacterized protein